MVNDVNAAPGGERAMHRKDLVVLNVGGDEFFERSRRAIEWLLSSHAVSATPPRARYLSSEDLQEVTEATLVPTTVLHIMGHGDPRGRVGGSTRRSMFEVDNLQPYYDENGYFPDIDAVLVDACLTFTPDWKRSLAALATPGSQVLFIGTNKAVDWHESTTYTAALYAALMTKGFPQDRHQLQRIDAIRDAHRRACRAYRALVDEPAPFRAQVLRSTRPAGEIIVRPSRKLRSRRSP